MAVATEEQKWKRSRYPLQTALPGDIKPHPSSQTVATSTGRPSSKQHMNVLPGSTEAGPKCPIDVGSLARSSIVSQHITDDLTTDRKSTEVDSESLGSSSPSLSTADYHLATTHTPPEGGSSPSARGPGTRTLRRTSRSQRIQARISLADMDEPNHPQQREDSTSSVTAVDSSPKLKQQSSWETFTSLSAIPKKAISSLVEKLDIANDYPAPDSMRHETALPASPPLSESEEGGSVNKNAPRGGENVAVEKTTKTWQRRAYPMQISSFHLNQNRPLTPLTTTEMAKSTPQMAKASTLQEGDMVHAAPNSHHQSYPLQSSTGLGGGYEKSPASGSAKSEIDPISQSGTKSAGSASLPTAQREAYPIQSPAAHTNIQQTIETTNHRKDEVVAQAAQKQDSSARSKPLPRRKYPLQSPISNTNLQRSQASPEQHVENKVQETEAAQGHASGKVYRRRAYPLQSPASTRGLRVQTPGSQAQAHGQANVRQGQTPMQTHIKSRSLRRQRYPLQSPASTDTLQPSPSISSSTTAVSERWVEDETARPVATRWHPADTHDDNKAHVPHVLLPKHVRAIKDAETPPKGRTIVVCLDGTGDKFDDDNSNIVHLVSALKKDDPQQLTYYQAGIGTYNDGGLSSGAAAALDMAVGSGLGLHIRDAYHFLMHSYKEGDRICIFGFSRGAYTARCLAGMIHKVGLLPPRNIQQIQFAYQFYKKDTAEGWQQSNDFKRAFSIDVCVHFLGCFDSVASVGFIPRQLPLSSTPGSKPRYFRHAMALDERRAKFKICRYQSAKKQGILDKIASPTQTETKGSKALDYFSGSKDQNDTPAQHNPEAPYGSASHPNVTDEEYKILHHNDNNDFDTDVLEVWFAGCHADIGGGAVANLERHKLAQIPLRWMVRQAFECNTGIIFKTKMLAEYGLDVHSLWPRYTKLGVPATIHSDAPTNFLTKYKDSLPPRSIRRAKLVPMDQHPDQHDRQPHERQDRHGEPYYLLKSPTDEDWTPEQVEDYYDAMTPMNDQLVQALTWWILEAIPVQYKVSPRPGEVLTLTGPNMGLARLVEDYDAHIHWTVVQRAQKMGYKAAARPAAHTEWQVVS